MALNFRVTLKKIIIKMIFGAKNYCRLLIFQRHYCVEGKPTSTTLLCCYFLRLEYSNRWFSILWKIRIQGKCHRDYCKYLHPPPHIKSQLEINGRNAQILRKNLQPPTQNPLVVNPFPKAVIVSLSNISTFVQGCSEYLNSLVPYLNAWCLTVTLDVTKKS